MFIFGLETLEVAAARSKGLDASDHIAASDALAQAIAAIEDGVFSPDDRGRYEALVKALRHRDFFDGLRRFRCVLRDTAKGGDAQARSG